MSINYYHYVNTQFSLCYNVFNKVPTYPTYTPAYLCHDFQRHLTLNTVILVFVNENCCLCTCFTELHLLY